MGGRVANIASAINALSILGSEMVVSSYYETAAWGNTEQAAFLNVVVSMNTAYDAAKILAEISKIEQEIGRTRTIHWGPRLIDIDILYVGQQVISQPDLIVPHPRLHLRNFVLQPLKEIAPNFVHPVLKMNSSDLLTACVDTLAVAMYQQ